MYSIFWAFSFIIFGCLNIEILSDAFLDSLVVREITEIYFIRILQKKKKIRKGTLNLEKRFGVCDEKRIK